ncbi:hypothetical protein [Streptomyces malaysiense]|uniref:Cysteinyl-tRNA synthetase n=1 Tax=Streptomyces malaysiense TaxID=1428626 RepID=A0A1J4PWG6_9ACTN|nr:hypothetical protein [Streptomyces malaysiense]OIK25277.1 hypothetical protein VT52_023110 [Streptomyces malaysiense]
MLRILDARTGEPVAAAPARRGLTRIEARAPGACLTSLRVLLTADILARALELNGLQAWPTAPGRPPELCAAADALAVRPFEEARGPGFAEAGVVRVAAREAEADAVRGEGPVLVVAPVVWAAGRAEPPLSDPALLADPTALRLALLRAPHGETVTLDEAALGRAAERLAGWRRDVAGWARQPSRPVPEAVRRRLTGAWEDDLDMPGVLEVLAATAADPAVADGARFETFAHADRLLALELTRDLGTPG